MSLRYPTGLLAKSIGGVQRLWCIHTYLHCGLLTILVILRIQNKMIVSGIFLKTKGVSLRNGYPCKLGENMGK